MFFLSGGDDGLASSVAVGSNQIMSIILVWHVFSTK